MNLKKLIMVFIVLILELHAGDSDTLRTPPYFPLIYNIEIYHAPLIDYFQDLLIDPDYEHIKKNIAFGIGKKLNKKLFISIGISLNAQDSSHFLKKSEHKLYYTFHIIYYILYSVPVPVPWIDICS